MLKRIISKVFTLSLVEGVVILIFLNRVIAGGRVLPLLVALVSMLAIIKISVAVLAEVLTTVSYKRYTLRGVFWGEAFRWPARLLVWFGSVSLTVVAFWIYEPMMRALGRFAALSIIAAGIVIAVAAMGYVIARYGLKDAGSREEMIGLLGWDRGWRKKLLNCFSQRNGKSTLNRNRK